MSFRSVWRSAVHPPKRNASAPQTQMICCHGESEANTGVSTPIRKTPALTMAAAWR